LREAKTLAESREQEEEAFVESRKSNFGAQFDDFQGTCHCLFLVDYCCHRHGTEVVSQYRDGRGNTS